MTLWFYYPFESQIHKTSDGLIEIFYPFTMATNQTERHSQIGFCHCQNALNFRGYTLCKAIQLQQYDTIPKVVRETSSVVISCKVHSIHILPY